MTHKPNCQLQIGALIIDGQDEAAIVVDDFKESPIRLIKKWDRITSAFADDLYELTLEEWKKLIVTKLRSS